MNETPNHESAKKQAGRRKTSAEDGLSLRNRDYEILKLVHEHRFLDTELIFRLLNTNDPQPVERAVGADGKQRPARYGFGMKALYKRLSLLTKARYLVPHRLTDQPVGRGTGVPRTVFGIGPKSIGVIAQLTGSDLAVIRKIVEANKVKAHFLRHALELATFRVILELACRDSGGRIRLVFWDQSQRLWDTVEGRNEHDQEERFSVFPDAFFILHVAGDNGGLAHYFLEVDRGTMPIISHGTRQGPDIRKKILGYVNYRRNKAFAEKYYYRRLPDGSLSAVNIADKRQQSENLRGKLIVPIAGFTVLFLTPGSIRSDMTCGGRLGNMLSAITNLGSSAATTSLFWFAPSGTFNLDDPGSIFGRAWITSNRVKGLQSLIE